MNIHDVRLDRWYKAPDGRGGQAAIIDNNLTHDVLADFSVWVKAAELEPADAPDATSDLEQRVAELEAWLSDHEQQLLKLSVWRGVHKMAHEWLTKQLDALEDRLSTPAMTNPDATPSEPLKVGDEVWVKGTVAATCPDKGNYRIDFGMGSCWCAPNTEIKRA